jgi:hypothetical protein
MYRSEPGLPLWLPGHHRLYVPTASVGAVSLTFPPDRPRQGKVAVPAIDLTPGGGAALYSETVTFRAPARLKNRRMWAAAAVAALSATVWVGVAIRRASRALDTAGESVAREAQITFTSARLDASPPAGFESIAAPSVFVDAAVYRGRLYVCGPAGVVEHDGERVRANYRAGFEIPAAPTAMAVGVAAETGDRELFVATAGEGLLAFDGSGFRQIRPAGAAERTLTAVLPLGSGRILLGTEKRGVLVWDGKQIRELHTALTGVYVTALAGDESNVWVGTVERGLLHWHAGEVEALGEAQGLPDAHVLSLAVAGDRAYAGTAMGVAEFVGGRFRRVLAAGMIARALLVREGTLLVGTLGDGVAEVPLEAAQPRPRVRGETLAGTVERLLEIDHTVYALTGGGLYRLGDGHGAAWKQAFAAGGAVLADRNISALAFDSAGRLWVGYFDRGLDIVDASFDRATHIEDDHVFCVNRIACDRESGTTAVATANGLVLFDRAGREREVLGRAEGLIANQVTDVLLRTGGMTVATPAGITFIDGGGMRSLYAFHSLVNNHAYALAAAGERLMVGTLGGLSVLDGGVVRANYTTTNSGLKHNWITAVVQVGAEWFVGTYGGGVLALDATGTWHGFSDLQERFEVNPNAMLVTERAVYAGSLGGGLYIYDRASGRWRRVRAELPSGNVTALAAHGGAIYVGTDNGLIRFREQS